MIHTPFRVGRDVLAEPGNGHDELSISRIIMSSVIRIAIADSSLTGGPATSTKLRTNASRFRKTEPDVPRHQSRSDLL